MVYNMAGQRRETLLEATLNTGVHSIEWSGRDHNENLVEDGMYIVVAKTPGTAVKQVIGVVNGGK
jgi:flagellar hook assembly protein FlgD